MAAVKSPKHTAALEWAAAGFHVFPVGLDTGKKPLTDHGVLDATLDAATIDEWWTQWPDANIACDVGASGHCVIDVDDKGDKCGTDSLRELERTHESLPATYTVRTPSGGRHLWFLGPLQNSVGRLGHGLDTRGRGAEGKPGYVLLPGSDINGTPYTATGHDDVAHLPGWISEELARHSRVREAAITDHLDTPENIRRASAWLATRKPAVEGDNGDQWTLTTAMFLRDMGISEGTAFTLLSEWNDKCVPPWDDDALAGKIANAYTYGQNEAGSKGVRSVAEIGFKAGSNLPALITHERSRFYPYDMTEQDVWPEPTWIIPHWLQDKSTFMLFGPPGSYKSFVALDIALSIAYGVPAMGMQYPATPSDVVYVAGEDAINIVRKRRPAWQHARRRDGVAPFYLVREMPAPDDGDGQEFINALASRNIKPKVVVLDTLSRLMLGLDLSGSADAGLAVKFISALQRTLDCTILVVHHTGKTVSRGELGSQVFRASFDTSVEVETKEGSRALTLFCRKQKNEEKPPAMVLNGMIARHSLVFGPVLDEDGEPIKSIAKPQTRSAEVGQALKNLRAYNRGDAVNTSVLAREVLSIRGQLTDDDGSNVKAMHDVAAQIRKAHKAFAQYLVSGDGEEFRWAWIDPTPTLDI